MSIYYYLHGGDPVEAICLGPRGRSHDHEYSGPPVYLGTQIFKLPAVYIDLLIERFVTAYPGAEILDEAEFDRIMAARGNPHVVYVSGDADDDIPLSKYLPEVESEEFKSALLADPDLLIR